MNKPTHVAPRFLVVGFGRSFIGVTMLKSAIGVQEISSGIAAAGDRGYNGKARREFVVDEANDLQEY